MEKILGLIVVMVYALWYFTAQGSIPIESSLDMPTITQESNSAVEEHTSHSELSQEEMAKVIKKVGEDSGWVMTAFKLNAIIAEKITQKETIAVTVNFSSGSFDITPVNEELKNALKNAFKI